MSDVSRETPAAPQQARRVFPSDRLVLAARYADLLATDGVLRGLIGPREAPRLWDRHLLNCAVLAEAVPREATVVDVGSGAGLPGLVLAIARPDVRVTLVEPLLRRTRFLDEVVASLGLDDQVEVRRGRAEELAGADRFAVVTARAVAPLARLLDWCMPLVAPDGVLLAMKGSGAADEVAAAAARLDALGCAPPELLDLGRDVLAEPVCVVRVAWADPGPVGWPRPAAGSTSPAGRRRSAGERTRRTRRKS
jgi:16S rRNA (guanine527-N7)-methyltransferase